MKCLKCGSECVFIERKLNGDATCWECFYIGKPEECRQTNFARITETPEALAEEMVFYHDGLWGFIRHNVPVIRMKYREDAVALAVEYLRQKVKE